MENSLSDFERIEEIGREWGCPNLAPCYQWLAKLHAEGLQVAEIGDIRFGRGPITFENRFMRFVQAVTGFGLPLAPEEDLALRIFAGIGLPYLSLEEGVEYPALPYDPSITKGHLEYLDRACYIVLNKFQPRAVLVPA